MTDAMAPTGPDFFVPMLVDLMVSGRFVRGQTVKRLADEHGISVSTMRNYSQMASRIAWSDSEDDIAEMKATSIGRLQVLSLKAESAAASAPPQSKAALFSSAAQSIKTAAEIGGALRPSNPIVNVIVGGKVVHPELNRVLEAVAAALQPWPDAAEAVRVALSGIEDGSKA